MKFIPIDPPRAFCVGLGSAITMKDCAHISLEPDEPVTFLTEAGFNLLSLGRIRESEKYTLYAFLAPQCSAP